MARVAPPRRRLLEPTTFLLDQFTAALCLVWGARLLRLAAVGPVRLLWAGMLLATAAAAVAGGIKHGYFSAVDTPLRRVVWRLPASAAAWFRRCSWQQSSCCSSRPPAILLRWVWQPESWSGS